MHSKGSKESKESLDGLKDSAAFDDGDGQGDPEPEPEVDGSKDNSAELPTPILLQEDVATGPLAFIESTRFQSCVGVVILCNAIMIGLETDFKFEAWSVMEASLLVFFITEIVLRVCRNGWAFFGTLGNAFDVLIVMAGMFDMWFMPSFNWLMGTEQNDDEESIMSFVQMFRLGRIIRLVRLVKIVQPLYRLALGIAEAVSGMLWVLCFVWMLLYAVAIICTRIIGHGEGMPLHMDSSVVEIQELFHNVPESMFALFEMMSCWSLMDFKPLFRIVPLVKLMAVLFYVLTAWALLAVMTGVVSEKMIAVKEQLSNEEAQREAAKGERVAEKVLEVFQKVDSNGSGAISREEFNSMLICTDLTKALMEVSFVSPQDLGELFSWLDRDKDGTVDIDEFIQGFRCLNDQLNPKNMLQLKESTSREVLRLEHRLVDFANDRFDSLLATASKPLRKVGVITAQMEHLLATLGQSRNELIIPDPTSPRPRATREALAAMEERVSAKIDELDAAVERLGHLHDLGLVYVSREAQGWPP